MSRSDITSETRRVEVDSGGGRSSSKGPIRGRLEALSSRFRQSIQTRTSSPSIGMFSAGVNTVEPADGVDEYYGIYEDTAIIFTSLWNFASDVWEPGYRVETDDEDVQEFLEEHWLPQAAVLYGGKHNDFLRFGKHTTIQRWARGGALVEQVRADPSDVSSPITGLNFIPPETVSFVPYEHKPILLDPDPDDAVKSELPDGLERTKRNELPAYIQYHKNAPTPTKRDPIPLSQNDVTRTIFNGDAAGVGTELDNFWGTPVTEIVAEDVAGFKNILRDKEEAIKTKAYGLWALAFDRDTLEYTEIDDETGEQVEVTEIIEWSDEDKDEVANEIENNLGPGGILQHDGLIGLDRLDGEVPDLIDDLEFYVSNITSALPTPLYVVGFESNINQFVTEGQEARYHQLIQSEREENERTYTEVLRSVVQQNLVENSTTVDGKVYSVNEVPEDLRFKVEPEERASPIKSLDTETIEKMESFMSALDNGLGDVPLDMVLDLQQFLELTMDLPEDVFADLSEATVDEGDPEVQEAADQLEEMAGAD